MAPSPSCSPGWAGPLWRRRPSGPSRARTEVEDAGVKEISLEISSSLVPCTILLIPAAAHWRGCAHNAVHTYVCRSAVGSVSDDSPIGKSRTKSDFATPVRSRSPCADQVRTGPAPYQTRLFHRSGHTWAHRPGWYGGKEVEVRLSAGRCVLRHAGCGAYGRAGGGKVRIQERGAEDMRGQEKKEAGGSEHKRPAALPPQPVGEPPHGPR